MKVLASLGIAAATAAFLVAAPLSVEISSNSSTGSQNVGIANVDFQANEAFAGKRGGSRSFSKPRRSTSKPSKPRRTTTKKPSSKSWSPSSVPSWRKGDKKPAGTYKSTKPAAAPKAKTPSKGFATNPAKKSTGATAKNPTVKTSPTVKRTAPKLDRTKRTQRLTTQKKTLRSPQARTTRLNTQRQRARSSTMYRSRSHVSAARADARYWRNQAQYERNRRWANRNMYGWGYGFHPGMTYHHGWGHYGYGYTRSGLSVVDGLIIAALWNRPTYGGERVEVNVYNQVHEQTQASSEVMAAPQGTTISPDNKFLLVPTADGSVENFEIPAGSTIERTELGVLIQAPDGTAIMVPLGNDEYKPGADYEVPDYAQSTQVYADYGSTADESGSGVWMYVGFGFILLICLGGAFWIVRSKAA